MHFLAPPARGNYTATLTANQVYSSLGTRLDGNADGAAGGDYVLNFFMLPGDFNLDRRVNFSDLVALAQHYNQPVTRYADGDSNGDGLVNFTDLVSLAQNYNSTLAAPGAAPVAPSPAAAVEQPAPAAPPVGVAPNQIALAKPPMPVKTVAPARRPAKPNQKPVQPAATGTNGDTGADDDVGLVVEQRRQRRPEELAGGPHLPGRRRPDRRDRLRDRDRCPPQRAGQGQ